MAHVTLRFYGRFFYAEEMKGNEPANRILAIAPNFDVQRFGRHQCLMTVQRNQLAFGSEGELTTQQPAFRNVSDVANIIESEAYVWDLSGWKVTYGLSGAVSLAAVPPPAGAAIAARRTVFDIAALEKLVERPQPSLAKSARRADPHGRTNAIIELTSGVGTAKPVIEAEVELATDTEITRVHDQSVEAKRRGVPHTEPLQTVRVPGSTAPFTAVPADLVEFVVPLDGERPLTLRFLNASDEPAGIVTVKAGTTIGFSNLCAEIRPPQVHDLEFTQYYSLLAVPPAGGVLIPVDKRHTVFSEGQDCDTQAQLQVQAL